MRDKEEESLICWNCLSYDRKEKKCINGYPEKEKLNLKKEKKIEKIG